MRIWVDFENTPHVLILKPLIEELQRRSHQVVITARDCSQTIELANFFKFKAHRISHHHGKNSVKKVLGHASRICRLILFSRGRNFSLALSHGSRSQIIAAGILKIPTFVLWDYEYASLSLINRFIDRLVVPDILSAEAFNHRIDSSKIIRYPGIKEHIYVANLINNGTTLPELPLDQDQIIVTIRPPATEAHYHKQQDGSNELLLEALKHFSAFNNIKIIVLARTKFQQEQITRFLEKNGNTNNIIFPSRAQNGIVLIWNSDLVISGGGTMNREAAVLDVPVYSIFRGKLGAVDRYLSETGRLKLIQSKQDLKKIQLIKRSRSTKPRLSQNKDLIDFIIDNIENTGMMGG
jgi:predicted glycosyltransferase